MPEHYSMTPVGRIVSCFEEKFGVPRQPSLAPSSYGYIAMLPPWNSADAVAGLEQVSHLWLQFGFHLSPAAKGPKVRPPRLGGNKKLGVFATRSPVRPNSLGLSVVRLERIERANDGVRLHISGHDLVQGTPVFDIKPYLPYADQVLQAHNGVAPAAPAPIPVTGLEALKLRPELAQLIVEVLAQDPRPAYQTPSPERIYGMRLAGGNLQWRYRLQQGRYSIEVIAFTPGEANARVT